MTRILALASAAGALVVAACSSSTAPPPPPTAAQSAEFFDSIYVAELAAGDTAFGEVVAEFLELPPAYGAIQSALGVTTASGHQTWKGSTIEEVDNTGDSEFVTVAYSDVNLTNIVFLERTTQGNRATLAHWSAGTLVGYGDSAASVLTTLESASGACALQNGLRADSLLVFTSFEPLTGCQNATFNVSASATFAQASALGLESWSVTDVPFKGPRLTFVSPFPLATRPHPSATDRLLSLLRRHDPRLGALRERHEMPGRANL